MAAPFQDRDDDEEDFETDEDEQSPEAMRARLEAREAELAAERERNRRHEERLDEILRGPSREAPAKPLPALGPMPDPAVDFEAYQRWHAEDKRRTQLEIETRLERVGTEATTQSRGELLWNRFQAKYPALARRTTLVEAAYQDLNKRGQIPRDIEGAVDAVKAEVDRQLAPEEKSDPNRQADPSREARPLGRRKRATETEAPAGIHDSVKQQKIRLGLLR